MKNFINSSPPRGSAWQAILLGALLAVSAGAQAGGTASNTDINNIAKLSYDVSGTPQTPICSSDTGNSTADTDNDCSNNTGKTTFKVDKKVDVLVDAVDVAYVDAAPGQNATPGTYSAALKVLTFTVTNEGNDNQSIHLSTTQTGVTDPFDGGDPTDEFDGGSCTTYVDDGDSTFDSGDTVASSISSLAPDTPRTVFVVCSIPANRVNGDDAAVALVATVGADAGAAYTSTDDDAANTAAGVQIVFADADGPYDANRDAAHSDSSAYNVTAAGLTVSKIATTICDPANGSTTPYNIPGAAVQYAITITNASGATSATLSQITDALQTANLDFDPGLISGSGAGTNCVTGTGNLSASGFGAVMGTGTTTTTYAAPGLAAQATTAGATQAAGTVTIDFATLATSAITAPAAATLPANSYITIYFNAFVK